MSEEKVALAPTNKKPAVSRESGGFLLKRVKRNSLRFAGLATTYSPRS
jgi:hypothetical protein